MNKGFWLSKGTDGDQAFDNPSRIEPKRSHQWFIDDAEPELFLNKKQAVQIPNSTKTSRIYCTSVPSWDNTAGFQTVPNQFVHRLLGSESARSANFDERNLYFAGTGGSKATVNLSVSRAIEDPEACPNYGGFRKVKVNQVKDSGNCLHAPKGHSLTIESDRKNSTGHTFNGENESVFTSIGHAFDKEDDSVTLMGYTCHKEDAQVGSTSSPCIKDENNAIPIGDTYNKDETNLLAFGGGFGDAHDIVPVSQPMGSYDHSYKQSSVQT